MRTAYHEFDDYLREYGAQGVGPLLYELILDIVQQVAGVYPPNIYSPNGTWDEDAVSALAHDFTLEKLLRLGWLEHYLLAHDSTAGLVSALSRDFRHFLINRRKRTEYGNLFKRVRGILEADNRFVICAASPKPSATLWGLASWDPPGKGNVEHIEEVVAVMFTFRLPPLLVYRPDSLKLSHLISNKDLAALLEHTFRTLDKCVTLELLMSGLRYRLNLLDVDVRSLEQPVISAGRVADEAYTYSDVIAAPGDVSLEAEVSETANDLYERLSNRQRAILVALGEEGKPTLEQIGEIVGISKSTVSAELKVIAERIHDSDLSEVEAERVLLELMEIYSTRHKEED